MLKVNKNKIELIGKITSLSKEFLDINNNKFMFFDIVQNNKINNSQTSSYYKIKLSSELMARYKDIIKISNNIYVSGYLNTYLKENRNVYYIFPKVITLLDKNYQLGDLKTPTIDYDTDGVMLWNGKRCESTTPTDEELKELETLLNEFK